MAAIRSPTVATVKLDGDIRSSSSSTLTLRTRCRVNEARGGRSVTDRPARRVYNSLHHMVGYLRIEEHQGLEGSPPPLSVAPHQPDIIQTTASVSRKSALSDARRNSPDCSSTSTVVRASGVLSDLP